MVGGSRGEGGREWRVRRESISAARLPPQPLLPPELCCRRGPRPTHDIRERETAVARTERCTATARTNFAAHRQQRRQEEGGSSCPLAAVNETPPCRFAPPSSSAGIRRSLRAPETVRDHRFSAQGGGDGGNNTARDTRSNAIRHRPFTPAPVAVAGRAHNRRPDALRKTFTQ